MFYEQFIKLCVERGIAPSAAVVEMGFAKSAVTYWKRGSTPTDATLLTVANYFGVSVEYLQSGIKKEPVTDEDDELTKEDISDWLTKASKEELLSFIQEATIALRDK